MYDDTLRTPDSEIDKLLEALHDEHNPIYRRYKGVAKGGGAAEPAQPERRGHVPAGGIAPGTAAEGEKKGQKVVGYCRELATDNHSKVNTWQYLKSTQPYDKQGKLVYDPDDICE